MPSSNKETKSTSKDVAKLVGVSQSTVSRAFSANNNISEETKENIFKAAKLLNYHPNAFARGLVSSRSNFIGIVKGYNRNPAFSEMLSEFTRLIQLSNKQVIYFEAGEGQDIDEILWKILQYQVEGLLLLYVNLSSEITIACQKRGIPVLQAFRFSTNVQANVILSDSENAARHAADYLVNKGYRNFAYIAGEINSSSNMERQFGFLARLHELGFENLVVEPGDYTYESGKRAMASLAKRVAFPCGVLCANDMMALGSIDACKYDLKRSVPHDIGIIGFDNIFISQWPSYSLTTFKAPISLMAKEGLDILYQNIENKNAKPITKKFPLELIERNST